MSVITQDVYQFGAFQLNLNLRVLVREGQRVPVGPKSYDVLVCLVTRAGTAVSKTDLMKQVWPDSFVEEGTLTQHVFSLRKALGDKADCIVTVPGFGYRFAGSVERFPQERTEKPPDSSENVLHEMRERTHMVFEEPVPAKAGAKAAPSRTWPAVIGAVALLALASAAGWKHWHRVAPPDSLGAVVADFANTTGDGAFDRTLKRALEIDLGQSPYMNVMGDMEGVATLGLMGLKPDTPLTSQIALEICERTNRQVLLTGTIASVGGQYLLTLEATDCRSGKRLAASKATAANKSKVLDALDTIADRNRSKLGESAKSLQRYEVPIADGATPSLDALKAYSMGVYLLNQGKIGKEAAPFFQKAIEIDPHFAQAYGELAAAYYNMQEDQLAGETTEKLCALDAHVGERTQLAIDSHCEKDIFASLKIYRMWTEEYPHDWVPWLDIANIYNQMGRPEIALPAARRAFEESGRNQISYDVLIRACKDSGHFAEAKSLAAEAARTGKDSAGTHGAAYRIAVYEHDAAGAAREAQWQEANKDEMRFYNAAEVAAMEGKYRQAEELFGKQLVEDKQLQETEISNGVVIDKAAMERELLMPQAAKATLAQVIEQTRVIPGLAVEHALQGDSAFAERFLAMQQYPAQAAADPTFMPYMLVPQIRAAEAMHAGKPLEAIAALENARPMELADYSTPTQRGAAALKAGQAKLAEAQYREILASPALLLVVEYPLAHLGLARALALEGDTAGSRKEYQAFLGLWKDADPDVPVLMEAKAELARLR